ncbi:hypothetical protein [Streptomyces sp. NPDC048111]
MSESRPCRWCQKPVTRRGRWRVKAYCNGWHRLKQYLMWPLAIVLEIFS